MGDFSAIDLWGVSYTQAGPETPCAECGGSIDAEDRCYADWNHIWHSRCWWRTEARRQVNSEEVLAGVHANAVQALEKRDVDPWQVLAEIAQATAKDCGCPMPRRAYTDHVCIGS